MILLLGVVAIDMHLRRTINEELRGKLDSDDMYIDF